MDAISNNPKFKKRIIIIWASALLIIHTLFTLLSVRHAYIRGDYTQKSADAFLEVFLPILAFIIIYLRYSVLVSAYHSYRKGTLPFTLAAICSFVLTGACDLIIKAFIYTNFSSIFASELLGAFLSFMIELAVVIIIFLLSRRKRERSRKITKLIMITCAFPLAISLFEEIWFLVVFLQEINDLYGSMAISSSEFWSIVQAFAIPIAEAVLGFVFIFVTHKILLFTSKKHADKTQK